MTNSELLSKYLIDKIGFISEPVSINEFISSPYYLGKVYTDIFPYWKQKLNELYPNNLVTKSSYVILTGAIGIGKSTFSKIVMAYDVYKMSLLRNPRKFYGVMSTSGYYIKCFNVNKYKAQPMTDELYRLFNGLPVVDGGESCPYFRDQLKYGNRFLKNLHVCTSSRMKDLISDDTIGFILSELNDVRRELANEVLKQSINRIWSRYKNGENYFNHLILDSSARSEGSLVDDFMKLNPSAKNAFIARCSHWESRVGMGMFGDHGWFKLYLGDSKYPPFVITNENDIKRLSLDPDQIMTVPMEYYDTARGSHGEDLQSFIQDVCGRSTSSSFRFFTEPIRVADSFTLPMDCKDIIVLDFYDKYDDLYSKLEDVVMTIPRDKKLYIGLDCGTNNDLFGLAIGYADGLTRYNENDGGKLDYLNIKIPIAIGLSRKEGQETAINKVHDFILRLSDDYEIGCVYSDQYQCLTGDTSIRLTDGDYRIEDIVNRFTAGDEMYTYTMDTDSMEVIQSKIINAMFMGLKVVFEVTLSNGETLECTGDHRFLLSDGTYKELLDITFETLKSANDSIVYISSIHRKTGYVKVFDLTIKDYPNFLLTSGIFVHNSTEIRQVLIQNNIPSERISIDRDDSAYLTLKRWIYQGLVSLPKSEILEHELLGLVRTFQNGRYKVEKPRDGISHGDVAAALTHVVSQIVLLGPDEVLSSSRMNKRKYSDILNSANKPRLIRPMM